MSADAVGFDQREQQRDVEARPMVRDKNSAPAICIAASNEVLAVVVRPVSQDTNLEDPQIDPCPTWHPAVDRSRAMLSGKEKSDFEAEPADKSIHENRERSPVEAQGSDQSEITQRGRSEREGVVASIAGLLLSPQGSEAMNQHDCHTSREDKRSIVAALSTR